MADSELAAGAGERRWLKLGAKQRAVGFAAVAILTILAYMIAGLVEARNESREHAARLADNLSSLLASHFDELVARISAQLDAASEEISIADSGPARRGALRRASFHARIVAGMASLGPDGDVIDAVGTTVRVPDLQLGPIGSGIHIGLTTPEGLLPVWKGRHDERGGTVGFIVAFIDTATLRGIMGSLNIGATGATALWRDDGILLARTPHVPDLIGRSFPGTARWAALRAGEVIPGAYSVSAIDQESRVYSVVRLGSSPVVVSVGVSDRDNRVSWWSRAVEATVITAVVAAIIAILGLALLRRIAAQEAAEQARRVSERRLREALEVVRDAVWEWDRRTGHFYLSPVWDRIVGSPQETPARMETLRAQIHPADLDKAQSAMRDHLGGLSPSYDVTLRVRHASGSWIWLQVRGRALRDGNADVSRVVGTVGDVSERIAAEDRLTRSEERFRNIVSAMADWAWETDRSHRIVWISKSIEQVTGTPAESYLGKLMTECDLMGTAGEAGRRCAEAMSAQMPFRDVEYERRTSSGMRWLQSSGVPNLDDTGAFAGFRGTGRDVTDLRRAQHLLREALENMPAGVLLFDAEDRLVLSTERNRHLLPEHVDLHRPGITFEEMLHATVERGLLPDAEEDPERWIKARLDRHRAAAGSILVHYRDRIFEVFEHRTYDGGCLMLRFDVTERERLGERLRQAKEAAESASRAKSQFLANMSHELRTPLNAIIGFSQLLEGELLGPIGNERYREYAGDIRDSGEHLLTIISDILDLSRVEAGRMVLEPVETDVVDLLRTGERWEKERAQLEGVELRLDVPEQGLRWTVDPTRLKQAIVNLVSNAVKFTPRGGRVTLAASASGETLRLQVSDTGVGMTAAQIEQALQPFGQVQNAMSRKHAGTGLGLPLTKALVELHGGALEIESTVGVGTTVTAILPARGASSGPRLSEEAA